LRKGRITGKKIKGKKKDVHESHNSASNKNTRTRVKKGERGRRKTLFSYLEW
jgi:hypothetical protein